jgi:uncharacterized protein (DUF1778 family)
VSIKRAAEIQGRSVSDFVVTAAHEAAQQAIGDAQIIARSVEDQRAPIDAILHPPTRALSRAKRAHGKLIAGSR